MQSLSDNNLSSVAEVRSAHAPPHFVGARHTLALTHVCQAARTQCQCRLQHAGSLPPWLCGCKQVVVSEEMDLETLLTLSESDIHDLGIEGEEATKLVEFIASHS